MRHNKEGMHVRLPKKKMIAHYEAAKRVRLELSLDNNYLYHAPLDCNPNFINKYGKIWR